jgi:glycosyltransferase involved in cell wall biosynthesis
LETIAAGQSLPKVSVIIPAYNTAPLIANCLNSVFAQTFRDFEVIIVNDGSPDTPQLEEALLPYKDRVIYIVQPNKRAAGARNTAIGRARGTFLAFLDSDDSWLPDHLSAQMELFERKPDLDLVYADALLISDLPHEKTFMQKCPSEGQASFEALVVERCQLPISTVVARKAAIVKGGMFDEKLVRCDDYDMWLRAAFCGAKIGYGRQAQARLFLGRPDSLGETRSKMAEAYWMILEKAVQTLPLNVAQRKLVVQRSAEIRARYLIEEGKTHLREHNPEKARELFAEANLQLHRVKLSLAIRGLQLAPQSASKLFALWNRFRRPVPG